MSNRNDNARYELAPQVAIERSTIPQHCNVKTSFDVGQLVPFYCQEILPGTSLKIETAKAMRLQTLITPVMDNLYLDTYYFFVPNRLVWDHWEEFCGANKTSAWVPAVEYAIPQIVPPDTGWDTGTIADYLGLPPGIPGTGGVGYISALPFRAVAKIIDDWFRDENLQDPINIYTGDNTTIGSNGDDYVTDIQKGGKPFVACKYHDYFTSALPAPLKASAPISFLPDYIPVIPHPTLTIQKPAETTFTKLRKVNGAAPGQTVIGSSASSNLTIGNVEIESEPLPFDYPTQNNGLYLANLFADFRNQGTTINDLRMAFQIQRLLEKDARNGTRYIEIIKGHFGITSPDARLQRAEYLGGNRVPFNIEQVLQTSSTDATSPQGNVSGWSLTNDDSFDVNKSFVEHGYVIGLMCARYDHSYQQGMECHWFRRKRLDFYWPALAHIGEKAVYSREICWTGDDSIDQQVFGYQEAWAEYRYKPNYITGQLRSTYAQSLDFWHFGDFYWDDDDDAPVPPNLSADWIVEDKSNVDRCLAVTSATANQIFGDILVNATVTLPMPLYSIPGLVDHF